MTPGVLPYWPSHATFLSRVMQHASTRCWRWAQQRPRRVEGPTAPLRLPEAAQHASNLDDLARAQRAGRWRGSLGLFSRGGPLLATSNACLSPMLSSWWAATWSSCPAGRPTSEQARAARSVPPSAPPSMQGARYRSMPEGARPSPGESDTAWARRERMQSSGAPHPADSRLVLALPQLRGARGDGGPTSPAAWPRPRGPAPSTDQSLRPGPNRCLGLATDSGCPRSLPGRPVRDEDGGAHSLRALSCT